MPIDHNVNILSFPNYRTLAGSEKSMIRALARLLNVATPAAVVHKSIVSHFDAVVEFLGEKDRDKLTELLTGVTVFLKGTSKNHLLYVPMA